MITQYLPLLVTFGVAITLALIFLALSRFLGPYRPNTTKLKPYESGMDPVGEAQDRFMVNFYLVAMTFIVFDIEVIFIYPWAVQFLELDPAQFYIMLIFIAVLFVGLFYELRKGALDWDFKRNMN
jgi:NADH-quinone oxidoreductase subunit A